MPDIEVDLRAITLHQARVVREALRIAIDSGELSLRENYLAAVEVKQWLSYRIACAEKQPTEPAPLNESYQYPSARRPVSFDISDCEPAFVSVETRDALT